MDHRTQTIRVGMEGDGGGRGRLNALSENRMCLFSTPPSSSLFLSSLLRIVFSLPAIFTKYYTLTITVCSLAKNRDS